MAEALARVAQFLGLAKKEKPKEDPRIARAQRLAGRGPYGANAGFADENIAANAQSQLDLNPGTGVFEFNDILTSGFNAVAPPIDGVDGGFDLSVRMQAKTFSQTDPRNGNLLHRKIAVAFEGAHGLMGSAGASVGREIVPPEPKQSPKKGKH